MPSLCKFAPSADSFYCQFYQTILCPGNRENCVRYEPNKQPVCKHRVVIMKRSFCDIDDKECDRCPMSSCEEYQVADEPVSKTDFPLALYGFCVRHHIVRACFEYEDGVAVDYLWLSDKEFQLSRVGDCATNYIVP